jgi:hypothetical protein
MRKTLTEIELLAKAALQAKGHAAAAELAASNCSWLHGAGYNGLKYLLEALHDTETTTQLEKDLMGLDLKGVSCVFIAPQVEALYAEHGRMFLRNVRHGLFLLRGSVNGNYGIGCPVDPGFALGGERTKNPYAEKMAIAAVEGVDVDDVVWQSVTAMTS